MENHVMKSSRENHVMKRSSLFLANSLLLFTLLSPTSSAASQPAPSEWVGALRKGGHVIVFRHGATHRDQADTDPLNVKNVAQQRQLNDGGRALARSMGDALRALNIPVAQVTTSQFQRAVDTGTLMGFGEVRTSVDITEGGLVVTPIENDRRMEAFRKLAGTMPSAAGNVVIVSHKPNIVDAFGKDWLDIREGEASIFRPDGNGSFRLIVRVRADEWSKLAPQMN
jgi:phosphohistidine phosphatase SixA